MEKHAEESSNIICKREDSELSAPYLNFNRVHIGGRIPVTAAVFEHPVPQASGVASRVSCDEKDAERGEDNTLVQ